MPKVNEVLIQRYDDAGNMYGLSIYDAEYDCSNAIKQLRQAASKTNTKVKVFRSDDKSIAREKYNKWCEIIILKRKYNERLMKEEFMVYN